MWRSALSGAIVLSLLEVVVTSSAATGRVGGFFDGVSTALGYLLSPALPLVPDRRGAASSTSTTPAAPAPPGDDPTIPAPPPIEAAPPTSTGVISV